MEDPSLKKTLFRNMNFSKIIRIHQFEIAKMTFFRKIIKIIIIYLSSIFKSYKIYLDNINDIEYIFIKTLNRKDYNSLFETVYDQCYFNKAKISIARVYKMNIKYIFGLISNLKLLFKINQEFKFFDSIYYYILINRYIEIVMEIDNYSFKTLIVFSDAHPIENTLIQYCNLKNIKTVTMQHGLYIDYNDFSNVHMQNYIDVQSAYLLAWGQTTKILFEKYNSSLNVIICGKPLELNRTYVDRNLSLIGVVFDQPMYREYNKKLLQIAYEIACRRKMKVTVRLHPYDDQKYYNFNQEFSNFENTTDDGFFILGHSTSMIYEYLALGYKVFKLKSSIPSNGINEALMFSNSNELEVMFEMNFDFHEESRKYIKYIGQESVMKYKKFFEDNHIY